MRKFLRNKSGAAAVELALVIVPFFGLTFAIFEIGFAAFTASSLENATDEVARMIRTGRGDKPKTITEFKTAICDNMFMGGDGCKDRLTIHVETFETFSDINSYQAPENDSFQPGGDRDIQLVRVDYRQPMITPLYSLFEREGPTEIKLRSTFAFRNEPYE